MPKISQKNAFHLPTGGYSPLACTFTTKRRYGNVPFWPTVYTVLFSYPASIEDYCIAKCLSVYTMPFS